VSQRSSQIQSGSMVLVLFEVQIEWGALDNGLLEKLPTQRPAINFYTVFLAPPHTTWHLKPPKVAKRLHELAFVAPRIKRYPSAHPAVQ
jgi:hypothetical protein